MRRFVILLLVLPAAIVAGVAAWKRNRRLGTRLMNERVNPFLVERGLSGRSRAEMATLEHFGRKSGARHLTPVHPEPTENGYRIMVPLGPESQWVRNVLAAGHCRLEYRGVVHELDEPAVLLPREMADLPAPARMLFGALGFTYLRLHRFGEHPGTLEEQVVVTPGAGTEQAADQPAPEIAVPEV